MELVDFELLCGPLDGEQFSAPAEPLDPPEMMWMADADTVYVRGAPCMCTGTLKWIYVHKEVL